MMLVEEKEQQVMYGKTEREERCKINQNQLVSYTPTAASVLKYRQKSVYKLAVYPWENVDNNRRKIFSRLWII